MYRIAQEALNNVAKHANATRVSLAIVERDGTVHLTVLDDGSGFAIDAASAGFGLIGMRERVSLQNGRFEIQSGAGSGTRIVVSLPASRPAAEGSNVVSWPEAG